MSERGPAEERDWLSAREAAAVLDVSPAYVYRIKSRLGAFTPTGASGTPQYRFPKNAVTDHLNRAHATDVSRANPAEPPVRGEDGRVDELLAQIAHLQSQLANERSALALSDMRCSQLEVQVADLRAKGQSLTKFFALTWADDRFSMDGFTIQPD